MENSINKILANANSFLSWYERVRVRVRVYSMYAMMNSILDTKLNGNSLGLENGDGIARRMCIFRWVRGRI